MQGRRGEQGRLKPNLNLLDLVAGKLVTRAVVELSSAGRFVGSDFLGFLDSAAVLEKNGDAGGTEAVVGDILGQAGLAGAALDHQERLGAVPPPVGELESAVEGAEERGCAVGDDAGGVQIGIDGGFGTMVGGHFVAFSAFFVQPEPVAFALLKRVLDVPADDNADAGEAEEPDGGQCPVAPPTYGSVGGRSNPARLAQSIVE